MADNIDITINETVENIDIVVNPNLIEVNITKIDGASVDGLVPYTGATDDINLGSFDLTANNVNVDVVNFDLNPIVPTSVGSLYWDNVNKTLSLIDGVGATTLQIGQEERVLIKNTTGTTLTDGQIVYITGATGNLPSVSLASALNETTSAATLGMVTETITNGSSGFVTITGLVNGLNTLAFNEGDILWLSNTAGEYTNVKPTSPSHLVLIGYVTKKSAQGSVYVKIQNTQELNECSDVLFGTLSNNDLLIYESSTGLWKNKQLSTLLGGTGSQFVKGNGSLDSTIYATQSALNTEITNRTNADATLTTNLNSEINRATTAEGTITTNLNNEISRATAAELTLTNAITTETSNRISGDASTLASANNYTDAGLATKQNALSGLGFVKINGTTISYDNVTYYPNSNPNGYTSNLGTVTSVGTSAPLTGGTITGTGTIGITQANTTTNGYLSSTDWNTFNNKQNALTNPITGIGTTNTLPKFTGASTLGNSNLSDNGTLVSSATDMAINGLTFGRGGGNIASNTAVGNLALANNTTGISCIAIGRSSLNANTIAEYNIGIGESSLLTNSTGNYNTAIGNSALRSLNGTNFNIAIGQNAGRYIDNKTTQNTLSSNSVFIGFRTSPLADNQTNQIVIGHDATGLGSNTSVIGNSSTTFGRWWGNFLVGTSTNNGNAGRFAGTVDVNKLQINNTPTTSAGTPALLTWNSSTKDVESVPYATFAPNREIVRAFYNIWSPTTLNTWRSWSRNTSNILVSDANQSLGTGGSLILSDFVDSNFIIVPSKNTLSKVTLAVREGISNINDYEILIAKASINNGGTSRGAETNYQVLVQQVFNFAGSGSSYFKDDFTIASHSLSSREVIFIAYRQKTGTLASIQGVNLLLDFK